jgi:beta-mannosidase
MKSVSLNGSWLVRPEALDCVGEDGLQQVAQAQDGWIEAQVPGEVHLDLIRAGQMPEPTAGANMPKCRWPETKSWWYRTQFEIEADFLQHERQHLVFDGLDLNAQVFVNGQLAGESRNAFVPACFDVKRLLRTGRNELVVRLTAGHEVAMRLERSAAIRGGIKGDVAFPQEWTLFGPAAKDAPEPALANLGAVPAELEVGGARLAGRRVRLSENGLDLEALLGDAPTGTTVYLLAELTLDEDTEATFGSGLLRWMKWWANGQVVFDDLARDGDEFDWLSLDNHCFNVRLRKGRNLLAVKAVSGGRGFGWIAGGPRELRQPLVVDKVPNPMREGQPYRHRLWPLRKWLRKPQFSYGWDWVDALPNIGIWRGVRLEGRTHVVLQELRLDTVRDGAKVSLEMEAVVENLHPWSERACVLDLEIQPPDGGAAIRRRYTLDVPPGRLPVRDMIEIPHPQLWWPNGMGEQPLYRIAARVSDTAGTTCDTRQFAIGLRTIEIDRSRLAEGSRFCLRVNGQEVFCRGGNLGPHDPILARISDAKYQALVAEARNANFNMLRINGCSIFESPAFYEACDRAGILVWQDFMLTCATYPDDDAAFCEAVRAETESAIRLLRHHPSIALWCGNNECTWGFREWWNPHKSEPLQLGGVKFYNQLTPDLCRQLDPRRPYWPSSPCGGENPNSELEGNCHWWYPFFMNADTNRRIRHEVFDECRARFVSEYGVIGPCHLDSIREYLAPEEIRPESLAWRMHTNTFEKETVSAAIRRHYADPEPLTVPEYVLYGQMYQAIMHGHILEALRFRKQDPQDDCQGALIWAYSDCWGETGWSILDYYLRRKPSYYWIRRAAAPLKVIVRQRGEKLVTRLVNDMLSPVTVKMDVGWWRLDGRAREIETRTVSAPANRMCEVATAALPAPSARDPRQWLYAAVLRDADGVSADQSVWTLAPHRELALSRPDIRTQVLADGRIEVSSPVYCHAVHAEDHGRELLSDNWFDLLPGMPVRLRIAREHRKDHIELEAVMPRKEGTHAL